MKPEVAESKIDSFSKERLHDGESIEESKNVAPSSIQNNYTFSFSLVTNRRVIVIVKLAILAVFTRRERESGYYERLVEWFSCSSRDFLRVSKQLRCRNILSV